MASGARLFISKYCRSIGVERGFAVVGVLTGVGVLMGRRAFGIERSVWEREACPWMARLAYRSPPDAVFVLSEAGRRIFARARGCKLTAQGIPPPG
jgi:PAS domain-containing protein